MLRYVLNCVLLATAGLPAAAAEMVLGSNFWNIGWHRPGDCFSNANNVSGENPWNEQFLKEISIYRCLRFMDWDQTNNSQRSDWSQRNTKANPKQNPVAYEWMIDLCNRNNCDMWVTLPHLTVNRRTGDQPCDYALRLCILVKTGVDMKQVDLQPMLDRLSTMTPQQFAAAGGVRVCEPLNAKLRLYIEYSNETWNGIFKQAQYCCEEGGLLGLDANRWTAGFRFHAWAAIRLFRSADLVFGADSKRVVRVLACFSVNPWIAQQHVNVVADGRYNPWKLKADAISTAPYFGHDIDGGAPDAVQKMRAAIQKCGADSARHKKIADSAGLALIAYEGGQHCTKRADVLNRNPAMHDLYVEYLREMGKYFTLLAHYNHVGSWGNGGAWGSMEFTGQPIDKAHKYRALVEWQKK